MVSYATVTEIFVLYNYYCEIEINYNSLKTKLYTQNLFFLLNIAFSLYQIANIE